MALRLAARTGVAARRLGTGAVPARASSVWAHGGAAPLTKIVATIGPASEQAEELAGCVTAGMRVMRLNFSHATVEEVELRLTNLAAAKGINARERPAARAVRLGCFDVAALPLTARDKRARAARCPRSGLAPLPPHWLTRRAIRPTTWAVTCALVSWHLRGCPPAFWLTRSVVAPRHRAAAGRPAGFQQPARGSARHPGPRDPDGRARRLPIRHGHRAVVSLRIPPACRLRLLSLRLSAACARSAGRTARRRSR